MIKRFFGSDQPSASEEFPVRLTEEEWRQKLSPAAFEVLRHQATERPGSSPLNHEKREGTFVCAGCGKALFDSSTKYESGCGWPSFYAAKDDSVAETEDFSHGMHRIEVHCSDCGGHLGHVFPDGPRPTGIRYCMNGLSLDFKPK